MKRFSNNQAGFTLVEMLVSTLIFSIIVIAITAIFVQILDNEQRAFAAEKVQENGLYIMELMSREIRVSQIQNQDAADCSITALTVDHPVNGTITYSLSSGNLERTVGGVTTILNSSDVTFSRLNFCVTGSAPTDKQQVRVAILASIESNSTIAKQQQVFNLETTVTSRNVTSELQQ